MKNKMLLFLALSQSILLNGQESITLLKEGKTWKYEVRNLSAQKFIYEEWISGDTLIDGRTYYKMYASKPDIPIDYRKCWREEDKKVYSWNEYYQRDELLYDFGASVGDPVVNDTYSYPEFCVKATGTTNAHGTNRHYQLIIHNDYGDTHIWVEGVGNAGLLTESLGHPLNDGVEIRLLSCSEDGECIFTAEDFENIVKQGAQPAPDNYRPLLEDGKTWTNLYSSYFTNWSYVETLAVGGDTLINDTNYRKIVDVATGQCKMALREADRKVYACFPNRDFEYLLYDFGHDVGETFWLQASGRDSSLCKVVAVDTLQVGGQPFRRLRVHDYIEVPEGTPEDTWDDYAYVGIWIEGIGSTLSLSEPFGYPGNYSALVSWQIDGTTYELRNLAGISDVTTNGNGTVQTANTVYDLQGRRVTGQPRRGVYIRDGRKRVR